MSNSGQLATTVSCRFLALIILTWHLVTPMSFAVEKIEREIEFARIDDRRLTLDYYHALQTDSRSPLIIWVHGGAWRAGSRSDVPIKALLQGGFSIASVDYRLSPEAKFPAQIHDIKAAIRFLREHANRFRVDPDRFVIAGSSAGGHLAALVGVSGGDADLEGNVGVGAKTSSRVQAIVSFYGASNLQSILSQSTPHGLSVRVPALQLLLGGHPTEVPDMAEQASPVAYVDPADPPLMLIHGDLDPQMPIQQSHELQAAYQKVNVPVSFEIVTGGVHGGPGFFEPEMLDRVARFLKTSLPRNGR